jgi:hypothetical protein
MPAVVVSNAMIAPGSMAAAAATRLPARAPSPPASMMMEAPAMIKVENAASFMTATNEAAPDFHNVEAPTLIPAEAEKRPNKRPRKEPAAASATSDPAAAATKAVAAPPASRTRRGNASKAAPAAAAVEGVAAPGEQPASENAEQAAPEEGRSGVLVVHKAVRMTLKGLPAPYHVSSDFISALNTRVHELLIDATNRAHSNGRKTLRASDL